MVGDPAGVGELLAGVAEGLAVSDGRGDRVGEGEVRVVACVDVDVDVDVAGEELVADWLVSAGVVGVGGRTRK